MKHFLKIIEKQVKKVFTFSGTSIKPPADFNSESVKSSINDLINEDYQEQEEIFAEHHDEQKLEKFNSADNLINAIAYHSILQGILLIYNYFIIFTCV